MSICIMGTLNKELRLIKKMKAWVNDIGKTTLITGETFIEVMMSKVKELNTSHKTDYGKQKISKN